ncbi:MAG: cellulase family glycosylhydrolase [Fimbriimonadales bacterium]|nr:cellulase family glycosylhydrolase [Fimbriimonadales bacterium]
MRQRARLPEPTPRRLPRWRGFNLLNKFNLEWSNRSFEERDFEWIAELGFNFVRLPMDYRIWTDPDNPYRLREEELRLIDQAVRFGEKYRVHVQLNFHRAPGYTVASPPEPRNLWKDEEAQKICAHHWAQFAKRYQGIPNRQLSFNLFNEPANVDAESHRKVVERVVEAIRREDASRLIVCDGRDWGMTPNDDLASLGVAQATRGYMPFRLTHYRAEWVQGSDRWEPPSEYPLREGDVIWDKQRLWDTYYARWKELEKKGVGVMVGEFGAYRHTPHKVVLAWMRDLLELWKQANWGWALWNFRGTFGVIDSERADVPYENWRGHKLDRQMLQLLQSM